MEAEGLDALQQEVWEEAMCEDVNAALAAIRIIATHCRPLGLQPPLSVRPDSGGQWPSPRMYSERYQRSETVGYSCRARLS